MRLIRYAGSAGRHEGGFTLAEMLVSLSLCAFVVVGGGEMLRQLVIANAHGTDGTMAVIQVQNAAFWLTEDAMQAQKVELGDPTTGFPLTLEWTDWDNVHHVVTYSMGNMTDEEGRTLWEMERHDSVTDQTVVVADSLDPDETLIDWHATRDATLVFEVMSQVGQEYETRTYEIQPRPLQ